jgi:putative ABC transport system ATP-binding protein
MASALEADEEVQAELELAPVSLENLNHFYGRGDLRKQVLFDINLEIRAGEIVILTGPSGSGKTTALTLIGALRSAQEGSLQVLGQELRDASDTTLTLVRRQIGYIFQHHNLLESLTAGQNVQMALALHDEQSRADTRRMVQDILDGVGLSDKVDAYPGELSGGQKQRVAIARALVSRPRLILADEPTASLDRKSGRDAVSLMQSLAKEQGVTVVLVTHDNRILDIADRIIHLEDGQLTSFADAVTSSTQQMMGLLAESNRKGELMRRVHSMDAETFSVLLEQVTRETQEFLRVTELASKDAFESMLEQVIEAFTEKIVEVLDAERGTLFLLDRARDELWSKVATSEDEASVEIRIPSGSGIAGAVATSGETLNIPDAYEDARFDRSVDESTGFRTRSILAIPLQDQEKHVLGVAQILNRRDGEPFDAEDERRFANFIAPMGIILESWWKMSQMRGEAT